MTSQVEVFTAREPLTAQEQLSEVICRLELLTAKHEALGRKCDSFKLLLVESKGHFAHTCTTGYSDRCTGCQLERRISDALTVKVPA